MTDKRNKLHITDIRSTGKNKAVGNPPSYFGDGLIQIWHEVRNNCPEGTFESKDSMMLEMLCNLLNEKRDNPKRFSSGKYDCLLNCYKQCLMTPNSRAS